jgi:hypothetical protein
MPHVVLRNTPSTPPAQHGQAIANSFQLHRLLGLKRVIIRFRTISHTKLEKLVDVVKRGAGRADIEVVIEGTVE